MIPVVVGAAVGAVDDKTALLALIAIVAVVVRELLKWLQTRSAPAADPDAAKKIAEIHEGQARTDRKVSEILDLLRRENPATGQKDIYVPRQLMDELGEVAGACKELDRRLDDLTHQSGAWAQPRGD